MDSHTAASHFAASDLVPVPTRLKTKRPIGRWRGVTETPQSVLDNWPADAGVGILTGPSRIVVVDLDVKTRDSAGKLIDGVANWSALLARLGLSAFAPQETTPSGGQHVYFHANDDRPLRTGADAKIGIDIRGDGGFIVCAPTPGYEFTSGITPENFAAHIYTMPPALLDHFSKGSKPAGGLTFKSPGDVRKLAVARERTRDPKAAVDTLLNNLATGSVPGGSAPGNQSQAIFWTACRIWELEPYQSGIADASYPGLLAVVDSLTTSGDPWTEESILPTWQSARRSAEEAPLIVPDENELAKEDDLPWTDIGNAERLRLRLERRGTPALYSAGSWLVWDGKRWARDYLNTIGTASVAVASALKELADIAIGAALAEAGPKEHMEGEQNKAYSERRGAGKQAVAEAHELKDWAKWSGSARGVKAMQELLSSLPGLRARPEAFDTDPALLNVENGTLNLRDSSVRPHDPADRITKLIPIRYNPTASALRWEQFLTEVFTDPELPQYYQRLIGYGITGMTTEQCLIVQHGKGANGKDQTDSTPMLTLRGWVRTDELTTEDFVYGPDGEPTRVTGIYPQPAKPYLYRLTTSDGRSLTVGPDHLWTVRDRIKRAWDTITTADLLTRGLYVRRAGRERRFELPVLSPLDTPRAKLPIDPYVFGAWLGDGTSRAAAITVHVDEKDAMAEAITRGGFEVRRVYGQRYTAAVTLFFQRPVGETFQQSVRDLAAWDSKFIPDVYLTASISQRAALLRGLMDTDGCVSKKQGQCEFTNTNRQLAEGVLFLLRSLGYVATIREARATLYGVDKGPKWRVFFTPSLDQPSPFSLPRKTSRLISVQGGRRVSIDRIERVEAEPTRCIRVDRADHLYVAGRDLVVTHNTVGAEVLRHVFSDYALVTSFDTFEERQRGSNASPEIVRLKGARLAFASEGSNGGRLAEAAVKRLTGDEHITARELYKGPVTFKPEALIILSTNHLPEIQGADDGIWRRVRLIPWSVQFSANRQDPTLAERLKRDESEGILAWAVAGSAAWFSGGLQHPASVVTAGENYRGSQNVLSGFLPGVLFKDPDARILLSDAYKEYRAWTDSEGLSQADIWSKRQFQRGMESREIPTVTAGGNKRYLVGIRRMKPTDSVDIQTPVCDTVSTVKNIATAFGEK